METTHRPRLLYIAVYDPGTPLTGTGVRGHQFLTHLTRYFDVDLVHLEGSGQRPREGQKRSFKDTLPGLLSRQAVPFSGPGYFFLSRAVLRHCHQLLKTKQHNLILCDYGLSAVYGLYFSKKYQIPWVYSSHNIEHQLYRQKAKKDLRRWILLPWVWAVEKWGVRSADRLIAITDKEAAFFSQWTSKEKILSVPQGFDPTVFHPPATSEKALHRTILFCGNFNISFNRSAAHFIRDELVEQVTSQHRDVRFVLVGANPPDLEPHPALSAPGFVEDYPRLLRSASLVISPMFDGGGFPTKIVEALACGKTVLATPTGARGLKPDLQQLVVQEKTNFLTALLELLETRQPLPRDDFEVIRRHYSWDSLLDPLCRSLLKSFPKTTA